MRSCLPDFCITAWRFSECRWTRCGSRRSACCLTCGNATNSITVRQNRSVSIISMISSLPEYDFMPLSANILFYLRIIH
nr:MAG TPA: hypothetical protein [Caudoviricetes sp.]